ncbi:MAG TPA: hypothetical protein VHW24_13655 [Bryobacteraceae bacterium]|jgi:uncharacterized coiled-coil protein SlyX|nr:hypothetical protein [Bryobacteraceae bacterium]
MARPLGILGGCAAFLAGVAAGALTSVKRPTPSANLDCNSELQAALRELERRVAAHEAAAETRFSRAEGTLEEHASRLAEMPSTGQIVSAMEQLLIKTMSSLDERLNSQAHSIENLRTTVAQTDTLMERVLESLDSLQSIAEPAQLTEGNHLRTGMITAQNSKPERRPI